MADPKVNFGVIGAGGIARRRTIPAMLGSKYCRVAAVMDVTDPEAVAAQFGVARAYHSEAELLADPQVQAVYIASPVHCHARQIEQAARTGKHVLCEKPLTLTSAQAQRAIMACRRHGVFLQVGYMMTFHAVHRRIRGFIERGRLGTIVSMRAQLACWYPPIPGAWRQDPRTGGGGALIDMASHLYDLLEFFAGPIRRLAVVTGNLVQAYRPEDSATTLLEFHSGAHATVDCFYCVPDQASRTRLEIYGSRGAVLTEGTIGQGAGGKAQAILDLREGGYEAAQAKDQAPKFEPVRYRQVNPYTAECDTFARCILTHQPPEVNDAGSALRNMALIEKAYQSARTGRFVSA